MSNKLERILRMEEEIRKERYPNVETFCRMFEVQPRTVYDDISYMKDRMGLDIAFDRFKNGYYNKSPQQGLPAFELTSGEVFALTLGKEILSQYLGTSFEPILRSALDKISERLPEKVEVEAKDVRSMLYFNAGRLVPFGRKLFLDLSEAVDRHRCVRIIYYAPSTNDTTERVIEPERLTENGGTWYVAAYCRMRDDLRMFALHRMRQYEVLDEEFKPRTEEEINDWLSQPFQIEHRDRKFRITIRFKDPSARYIRERNWHESQELIDLPDGGCLLSFDAPSLEEVKRWVLSYGADADVLEPLELRQMMLATLEEALNVYLAGSRSAS